MEYSIGMIIEGDFPMDALSFVYAPENLGKVEIVEVDRGKWKIQNVPQDRIDEIEAKIAVADDGANRVPDLEDATIELAEYAASLEQRIAELEARLNG